MARSRRDVLKGIGTAGIAGVTGVSLLSGETAAATPGAIPQNYLSAYEAAGREYGIDWTYLAGIGWQETHHGQYPNPDQCAVSSAGAKGPMQFTSPTWETYGVDANGDGAANICDYQDAIPAAANKLTHEGAPQNWDEALYHYNHSSEYVASVKSHAAYYRDQYGGGGGGGDGRTFHDGDQVQSTADLNTRYRPGTDSRVLETEPTGTTGQIMNGPVSKGGYTWWGVHWADDVWGWSVEKYLKASTGSSGSTKGMFTDGQRVNSTTGLHTRYRPGLDSRVLETESTGTTGEVMNGPTSKDSYTWWGIHWSDDVWGWSVEKYLTAAGSGGGGGGGGGGQKPAVEHTRVEAGAAVVHVHAEDRNPRSNTPPPPQPTTPRRIAPPTTSIGLSSTSPKAPTRALSTASRPQASK